MTSSLSPEQKRVKIAEACGWIPVNRKTFNGLPMWQKDERFAAIRVAPCDKAEYLPNYLSDLNAMAEAEKTLTQEQCFIYRDLLQAAVLRSEAKKSTDFVFGATAEQRADALILTLYPELRPYRDAQGNALEPT